MFSKSSVTLNIESSDIRYLVVRGKQILSWGSIPLESDLVRQGSVSNRGELSSAINNLFTEKKLPRNGVISSLPGIRSVLRLFRLPKMKPSLLNEAIQHEAEREMPVPLDELYLCRQLLSAKDAEQQFFVLGVPKEILDSEVKTLAQAGIRPDVINLKPLALVRAVNKKEALIIDLEPDTFDILVVAGGIPAIIRTVTSKGTGMILEDRVPQLRDELARTMEFYNSSHPEMPLDPMTPIILTGILADDPAARESVGTATNGPVELIEPPGSFPPGFPIGQYAVNIGLARRNASSKNGVIPRSAPLPVVNPNLLQPRYKIHAISPSGILFTLAAMCLIAPLLFIYQWKADIGADIVSINDEIVSVNLQIDNIKEAAVKTAIAIGSLEEEATVIEEECEAILAVLVPSNISDSLQPALNAIPEGIKLTSINQSAGQISLNGDAEKDSNVANYVLALERTGIFSTVYAAPIQESGSNGSVSFTIVGDIDTTSR